MIVEIFSGILVSILAIISFLSLQFIKSINKWILVTSKFIYYSGHPLLDDDQIYDQITKRFNRVFTSLIVVIFKTIIFLSVILLFLAFSSFLVAMLRGTIIPNLNSSQLFAFLFPKYLIQIPFIIGTLIPIFLVPIFIKNKKEESDSYSSIEKFLHYTFMGNKNIARFLFKLELWFNKKQLKASCTNQNVYISGMARAGTTVLMQYLGQLPEFKSLSYRNLPFLFLPKTWPKIISKKKTLEKERFHRDGMKHSINSYEALEEPFWRNYIGEKYIYEKTIINHTISKKLFSKYNNFRRLISGNNIYLAKNNNHLLRAKSLHKLDKTFGNKTITIIPFRDPYDQAKSLLNQHLLLSKLQEEDEFILDYMDFLVHHEFGLNAKTPVLDKNKILSIKQDNNHIEYWLEIWYLYYIEILEQFSNEVDFYLFSYENFKRNPKQSLLTLLSVLNLSKSLINNIEIIEFKFDQNMDRKVNDKYFDLYKKLSLKAINQNG
jgi:hypothetical protein